MWQTSQIASSLRGFSKRETRPFLSLKTCGVMSPPGFQRRNSCQERPYIEMNAVEPKSRGKVLVAKNNLLSSETSRYLDAIDRWILWPKWFDYSPGQGNFEAPSATPQACFGSANSTSLARKGGQCANHSKHTMQDQRSWSKRAWTMIIEHFPIGMSARTVWTMIAAGTSKCCSLSIAADPGN